MQSILAVALGGALGSVLRFLLNNGITALTKTSFPVGIMVINVLGSLAMGVLIALFAEQGQASQNMRTFLMVGVLGGFTTFSTFSADSVLLWQRGEAVQAVAYAGGSVILSVAALLAGIMLVKGLGA
ncbi:MAG: crcB-like family protein [Micavibrio sp.]|nr:crcB-like family protein [Micavibrio sp.]